MLKTNKFFYVLIIVFILTSFSSVLAYNYVSAITGTWKKSRDYDCWKGTTKYFNDQARCFYSNGTVKYLKNNNPYQTINWSMKGNTMTLRGRGWSVVGNITFPQQGQMLLHSFTYSNNRKTAESKTLYIKGNINQFYGFNYFSGSWTQYKRYNRQNGKVEYPNLSWYFDNSGNMNLGKYGAKYYLAGNILTIAYHNKSFKATFSTFQFDNAGNLTVTSPEYVHYLRRGAVQNSSATYNNYRQPRNNYNNNYNNNYRRPANNRYQLYKNGRNVLTDPRPEDF